MNLGTVIMLTSQENPDETIGMSLADLLGEEEEDAETVHRPQAEIRS